MGEWIRFAIRSVTVSEQSCRLDSRICAALGLRFSLQPFITQQQTAVYRNRQNPHRAEKGQKTALWGFYYVLSAYPFISRGNGDIFAEA